MLATGMAEEEKRNVKREHAAEEERRADRGKSEEGESQLISTISKVNKNRYYYMNTAGHLSVHKQDRMSKKEDAIASYEAWKEKKAESLKTKAKERKNLIRNKQRESEENEEKRQSAKQVKRQIILNSFGNYK